jgi:hypothetical protein
MDKKLLTQGTLALNQLSSALSEHKDLANKYLDVYQMNSQCKNQIRILEQQSRERIAEMTQRYQLCRDVLSAVFSERQTALNAHYATLDKALQSNDKDLIIASLRGISSIVEKNPLESFKEFAKVLDNKDETLYLDF